jgi:hypothetical protein
MDRSEIRQQVVIAFRRFGKRTPEPSDVDDICQQIELEQLAAGRDLTEVNNDESTLRAIRTVANRVRKRLVRENSRSRSIDEPLYGGSEEEAIMLRDKLRSSEPSPEEQATWSELLEAILHDARRQMRLLVEKNEITSAQADLLGEMVQAHLQTESSFSEAYRVVISNDLNRTPFCRTHACRLWQAIRARLELRYASLRGSGKVDGRRKTNVGDIGEDMT